MWKGTAPSLKARPDTMNTSPNTSTWWLTCLELTILKTVPISSDPVAP